MNSELSSRGPGWHLDGHDNGYRNLGRPIPLLQLKLGYYLSDMTEAGQGNLTVVPGSHKSLVDPAPEDLKRRELFPGALEVCAPAGSAILFHNALWHTSGIFRKPDSKRTILYYAYEHPWMVCHKNIGAIPKSFCTTNVFPRNSANSFTALSSTRPEALGLANSNFKHRGIHTFYRCATFAKIPTSIDDGDKIMKIGSARQGFGREPRTKPAPGLILDALSGNLYTR